MFYIDTSVLLVFTLNQEKESEKYNYVKLLFSKINQDEYKALTSFYALHELFIYAIQNSPNFDVGCEFGKTALKDILDTKIQIMPLLGRIERKLNARHFVKLADPSDMPHAISALVSGCSTIVTYDEHFSAISEVIASQKPEEIVISKA